MLNVFPKISHYLYSVIFLTISEKLCVHQIVHSLNFTLPHPNFCTSDMFWLASPNSLATFVTTRSFLLWEVTSKTSHPALSANLAVFTTHYHRCLKNIKATCLGSQSQWSSGRRTKSTRLWRRLSRSSVLSMTLLNALSSWLGTGSAQSGRREGLPGDPPHSPGAPTPLCRH